MTIQDLIDKYGSQERVGEVLGISESYVNKLYNQNKQLSLNIMKTIAQKENLKLWEVVKSNEEEGLI